MTQHLLNLALALAAGELVHNVIEAQEVRKKVAWLRLSQTGKPYYDRIPFAINTRTRSYAISLLGLVGFTAVFYGVFTMLNLSTTATIWTIIILLLLAYTVTAVILDRYHVEIARLTPTKPVRRKER